MLGKMAVPADLSKRLPGQGLELLSATAVMCDAGLITRFDYGNR